MHIFWGMLAAATMNIVMIPMLHVVFQTAREWLKVELRLGAKQPET